MFADAKRARLVEGGAGFGRIADGALVCESVSGAVYRIVSTSGTVHTGDRPGSGNYVWAELEEAGFASDLSSDEWDSVLPFSVEIEETDDVFVPESQSTSADAFEEQGYAAGKASGSWVTDGNTSLGEYRAILRGIVEGDPEIMDMQPSPLSGEWAGESLPEVIEGYSDMTADDRDAACDSYEDGFSQGFWEEVERSCRLQLDLTVPVLDRGRRYRVESWPAVAVYVTDQWSDRATVIVVGDDTEQHVDVSELVPIGDGDYCGECGQIGCSHSVWRD